MLFFVAGFVAVALFSWVIYALTHPVAAGQGVLVFCCKALGVVSLLSAVGIWVGQSFLQAVPSLVIVVLAFIAVNRLQARRRAG